MILDCSLEQVKGRIIAFTIPVFKLGCAAP
jgi:hypothetical protein